MSEWLKYFQRLLPQSDTVYEPSKFGSPGFALYLQFSHFASQRRMLRTITLACTMEYLLDGASSREPCFDDQIPAKTDFRKE